MAKKAIMFVDGVRQRETLQPVLREAGFNITEIFATHFDEFREALKTADKDTVIVSDYNARNFRLMSELAEKQGVAHVVTHWSVGGCLDPNQVIKPYPKAVLYDYGRPAEAFRLSRKAAIPNYITSKEFDGKVLLQAVEQALTNAREPGALSAKAAGEKATPTTRRWTL
jgi:hypothetical protein